MSQKRKSLVRFANDGGAQEQDSEVSRTTGSIARFRGTWNPVWMDDNEWLNKFKVDSYMHGCDDDGDDAEEVPVVGDSDDDDASSASSASGSALLILDDDAFASVTDDDGVRRLLSLFHFAARAVLQPTPWADPPLGKSERKKLLGVLLQRILSRTCEPAALSKHIKSALKRLQQTDVATDLSGHFISYMTGMAWEPRTLLRAAPVATSAMKKNKKHSPDPTTAVVYPDTYRSLPNFFGNTEQLSVFRDECDRSVEEKLHLIQRDVSRSEAKATRAIEHWNNVRRVDSERLCFGGQLVVELRDIIVDSGDTLREVTPQPPDEYEVIDVSRKVVPRTRYLSRKYAITISLISDGRIEMVQSATHKERPLALDGGRRLSWVRTHPVTFFVGHGSRRVETTSLRVEVRKRSVASYFCRANEGALVAQFDVPLLQPLYTNIAPFESRLREDLGECAGVHAQRIDCADPLRGVLCVADVYLKCLDAAHCQRPPPLNVALEEERRRRVMREIRDDVWKVDHHHHFRALADVLGAMDADAFQILDYYADRYLIHEELRRAVFLSTSALQVNFMDEEDRDVLEEALESMMAMRATMTTRIASKLVDSTIGSIRSQAIDRTVNLEFTVETPATAGPALGRLRKILSLTGMSAEDLAAVVAKRAREDLASSCRKLTKLQRALSRTEAPSAAGAVAGASRMSVLRELEDAADKDLLVGKARILVEVVDETLTPLSQALGFASASGDAGVSALIACRVDAALTDVVAQLETCIHSLISSMLHATSGDPNPLSDACGMLMKLYEIVMALVEEMQAEAFMQSNVSMLDAAANRLVALLNPFLPLWFHLCKAKQPSWIAMLVEHEPLEPIVPGRIFFNHTPADAQNLLDSLMLVFMKVLRWSDPTLAFVHITSFAKVIAAFLEELCVAVRDKSNASTELADAVVALCTHCRLCDVLEMFWSEMIDGTLIKTEYREQHLVVDAARAIPGAAALHGQRPQPRSQDRDMLSAQCAALNASSMGTMCETTASHVGNIAARVQRDFVESLLQKMSACAEDSQAFAQRNLDELRDDLHTMLVDTVGVALPQVRRQPDPKVAVGSRKPKQRQDIASVALDVRERCVTAAFQAVRDFSMTFSRTVLEETRKSQLMSIIEMVESSLQEWWPSQDKYVDVASVTTQAHKARSTVLWLCHSSHQLIHIVGSSENMHHPDAVVNRDGDVMLAAVHKSGDLKHICDILSMRTDKDAKKFIK